MGKTLKDTNTVEQKVREQIRKELTVVSDLKNVNKKPFNKEAFKKLAGKVAIIIDENEKRNSNFTYGTR